mgnify:CR=1 FL=1
MRNTSGRSYGSLVSNHLGHQFLQWGPDYDAVTNDFWDSPLEWFADVPGLVLDPPEDLVRYQVRVPGQSGLSFLGLAREDVHLYLPFLSAYLPDSAGQLGVAGDGRLSRTHHDDDASPAPSAPPSGGDPPHGGGARSGLRPTMVAFCSRCGGYGAHGSLCLCPGGRFPELPTRVAYCSGCDRRGTVGDACGCRGCTFTDGVPAPTTSVRSPTRPPSLPSVVGPGQKALSLGRARGYRESTLVGRRRARAATIPKKAALELARARARRAHEANLSAQLEKETALPRTAHPPSPASSSSSGTGRCCQTRYWQRCGAPLRGAKYTTCRG